MTRSLPCLTAPTTLAVALLTAILALPVFAADPPKADPVKPDPAKTKELTKEQAAKLEEIKKQFEKAGIAPNATQFPEYSEGEATKMLKHKNEQVRVFGIIRVIQNPAAEKAAVPTLMEMTGDREQPLTRIMAITALGAVGSDAADSVPNLRESLKDREKLVRYESAKALGKIGIKAKDALPSLVEAFEDKVPEVRAEAARSIGRFREAGKDAIPALVKLYKESKDDNIRAGALYGLGGIGPDAAEVAVPLMTAALKDSSVEVRGWAAASLGRMGPAGQAALPQLKQMTNDSDKLVRDAVRESIKALTP